MPKVVSFVALLLNLCPQHSFVVFPRINNCEVLEERGGGGGARFQQLPRDLGKC